MCWVVPVSEIGWNEGGGTHLTTTMNDDINVVVCRLVATLWKNGSSTTRDVNWSSTLRDGGRKGRTNSDIKVRDKRDLARIA